MSQITKFTFLSGAGDLFLLFSLNLSQFVGVIKTQDLIRFSNLPFQLLEKIRFTIIKNLEQISG